MTEFQKIFNINTRDKENQREVYYSWDDVSENQKEGFAELC